MKKKSGIPGLAGIIYDIATNFDNFNYPDLLLGIGCCSFLLFFKVREISQNWITLN